MVSRGSSENGVAVELHPAAAPSRGEVYLTPEDRVLLEQAKQEHAETTETAKRALKVAESTQDVARSTLVEVHRQGQQLDKTEAGFVEIEQDVTEASSLLRFMRRWCLVQVLCCCDCFDPDVQRDRKRKKRVAQRKAALQQTRDNIELQYGSKQQAVSRLERRDDAAYGNNEEAARSELMASAEKIKAQRRGPRPMEIGRGLPEDDRREIQRHTDQQDEILDRIGTAVGALKIMSTELSEELGQQAPKVDRLQQRAEASHDKLGGLSREARRV